MIILLIISYLYRSEVMSLPAWGLLIATLGLVWFWRRQKKAKRLKGLKELPGPRGIPLIGNVLQLGKVPTKKFCEWTNKYGDMYQVKLGNFRSIIISDPKLCKEIFSNDPALTGRMQIPEFDMYQGQPGMGMFKSEGERWEVHRRFLLRQLRDFGFGKSSMETLIMDEVWEVISMFQKKCGTPIAGIRETLRLAVVNSLWMIISSQRYDHGDPKLLKLANNTTIVINDVIEKGGLLIFMPWLKNIIPVFSGYRAVMDVIEENKKIFERTINEHKQNFREGELKDFIDVYLAEMKMSENDQTSMFHGEVAEKHLAVTLFDMFFAGSDTTATTIGWSILYLCKFPNVQKKLQAEISEVTGADSRNVSVDDRSKMPYTLAMIDEILRFSSIVPDGVQHRAMADREFHGYFIPKDALIQPNLYFIHHNPKIWGDPENFRPERFLTETNDGEIKYTRNESLQPFQVGRRQCVGESLARDTIFLYVTNIFQKFNIAFDPNEPEPSLESEVGFLRSSKPYSVIMKERMSGK